MNWYKESKSDIDIKNKIKSILKKHPLTVSLREYYEIPESYIDKNLDIVIKKMDKPYAEGNGKEIVLNKDLFEDNFFEDNFHFVIHEFFHWLKRRHEDRFYFNDSEEMQSFVLAITWQIMNGKNKKEIKSSIFPILLSHFEDENESNKIFNDMLCQALKINRFFESVDLNDQSTYKTI